MKKLLLLILFLSLEINGVFCQADSLVNTFSGIDLSNSNIVVETIDTSINMTHNKALLILEEDTFPQELFHNVTFIVLDGATLVSGAQITFNSQTLKTNDLGRVAFTNVDQGSNLSYNVSVSGYVDILGTLDLFKDEEIILQLVLKIPETYLVTFTVFDINTPISGVQIIFNSQILTTNSDGEVVFAKVEVGANLLYNVSANGFLSTSGTLNVEDVDREIVIQLLPSTSTGISIPNVITPNGDGVNDFLIIDGLIENSKLTIFNRLGKLVYQNDNYKNDWNGIDNYGNVLTNGNYWYSLDVSIYPKVFTGFIFIK